MCKVSHGNDFHADFHISGETKSTTIQVNVYAREIAATAYLKSRSVPLFAIAVR